MATEVYLAMSQEEIVAFRHISAKAAWLDCCFSPSGPGLDCLPPALPPSSLLILTDRFPFRNHDIGLISEQLCQAVSTLECAGVLLDFETREQESLTGLSTRLVSSLPCPVAVSESYASAVNCPVFMTPCPHHIHLADHIAPWKGREIWLDLARDAEMITVSPSGAFISHIPWSDSAAQEHSDHMLHCRYHMETTDSCVRFVLRRTKDDLEAMIRDAEKMGIQACVSLYQEWQ